MNEHTAHNPLKQDESLENRLFPFVGQAMTSNPFGEYARDYWERSVIFADILRRRGDQQAEITSRPVNSVLIYDTEVIIGGETLPRPVNYSLLRVVPPKGTTLIPGRRPLIVVDPRAGQGPGIGGFKPVSEIGEAFKAGHPVYFIGFAAAPVDGQTIEDVAHAHTHFFEEVIERHPEADGKPFILGNCQAGWHTMMAACMRPELAGPIMVAGAPLSYWGGVRGQYPMRYLGGMMGGSWLARLTSDLGDGIFDGAWLISNFDAGNPTNTYWTKQYNVWANPEKEQDRYLQFENWWGDFITLRGEEMLYMVDNLFVGNKLSTAQLVTEDGVRLDLRNVKSPIICFCSKADNITPVQQALGWIPDNYESVDEIRKADQKIFYCVHETSGHLAIFVGTKVAAKEHAEFINVIDLIDSMPPGLYEIVITDKIPGEPGNDLIAGDYNVRFEARTINDIRAFGGNSPEDEREFATVARMSEVNQRLYQTFMQPWVKAAATSQLADLSFKFHPLRMSYEMFSGKNPMMKQVTAMAEKVRDNRQPAARDNPFVAMQENFSNAMQTALDNYTGYRDQMTETIFHSVYGSPWVQAFYGISPDDDAPRPRPGNSPLTEIAFQKEKARLQGMVSEGGPLEAAVRALIYIAQAQQSVDTRGFMVLQNLLAAHPEVTLERFKQVVHDQWAILAIDEKAAIQSLGTLLAEAPDKRRAVIEMISEITTSAGLPGSDAQARLKEVVALLGGEADEPDKAPRRRAKRATAASS